MKNINIITRQGINWALLSKKDLISRTIFEQGAWSPQEVQLAELLTKHLAAPIIIDAGANLGAFCIPLALALKQRSGSIFAFEPQRIIFQQLCANLFLNGISNVFADNSALSSDLGRIDIPLIDYENSSNIGSYTLVPEIQQEINVEYVSGSESVAVTTIDMALKQAAAVNYLKLDVEGFESKVLLGAEATLIRSQCPPISFEFWRDSKFQGAAELEAKKNKDLVSTFLADLGYEIFSLGLNRLAVHPKGHVTVSISSEGGLEVRTN